MLDICWRKLLISGSPVVFSLVILFFGNPVSAQSVPEDSTLFQTAISNTYSIYYRQLGDQSSFFNGSHYANIGFTFRTGSPYFLSDHFSRGSVVYDGILFDSLFLLYEDLRQLLVAKNESYLLQFVSQRITSFTIAGHAFVRLVADSTHKGIGKPGFYEIIYPGESQVLKETDKNIVEVPSANEGMLRDINVVDIYYVRVGNEYMRVRSVRDLPEIFHAHQQEVQRFIKKSKLNFRRNKENTIVQTAVFNDQMAK